MKRLFGITLLTVFFLSASVAFAADPDVLKAGTGGSQPGEPAYVPMVGVPGLQNSGSLNAEQYIEAIYKLAIAAGAILAVLQIIYGGVTYMFDGIVTHKEAGKNKIKGAIFGLLIILSAVLILQTVNPELIKLKIFTNAPSIDAITGANNAPTPRARAQAGSRVLTTDTEGVKNLKATCEGPVATEVVRQGRTGSNQLVCYASKNKVQATVGSTFDKSLYTPQDQTGALEAYKTSCTAKGGIFNIPYFGAPQCNPLPLTDEEIGDVQTGNAL